MSDTTPPPSYSAQLAEVNAAITAIMQRGQRYTINGRELWRADVQWLLEERKRLTPLALRESQGRSGIRMRRGVPL